MACEDDGSLLLLLKDGDFSAYQKIFERHYPLLCAYAFNVVRDKALAEDVVQQLFTDLLQPKIYTNLRGNIKGYLFAAVHNRCIRVFENQQRKQSLLKKISQINEQAELPNLDLAVPELASLHLHHLRELIAELPNQRRLAVQLFYYQGKRQLEVARAMGVSLTTVKTHLKLALATFRKKLSQE